jgi:hypothetical protein
MRSLAVLAVAGTLLVGGSLTSVAASHQVRVQQRHGPLTMTWQGPRALHSVAQVFSPKARPYDATATAVPTNTPQPTPTTGPTATPTPTVNPNLPDPQTLLVQMANLLQVVKSVHFQEIGLQAGTVNLNITDTGDVICTGFGVKAHVVAKADVPGTTQSTSHIFDLIRIKNTNYWKDKSHTHGTWQPAKATNVAPFGFVVMDPGNNPLGCYANLTPGGATLKIAHQTGVQAQIKDLTNAGEVTFNKQDTYDLHFTVVLLDTTTNLTSEQPTDYYVGKTHPLLFGTKITFADTTNNVSGSVVQKFSKYGEKVAIAKPKKGSTKP